MMYQKVTAQTIADLMTIVDAKNVLVDKDSLTRYARDEAPSPRNVLPDVVVKPQTTEHVAKLLQVANTHRIPVTFRGQGTGLSCGAVPTQGGIVMSFEDMNRILEIDEDNLVAVVESGVVLLQLRQELERRGLFYPADPGETSSAIGGNVNTNAGGMNGVKYGNTRGYVLGLEVVLASGEVLTLGGKTVKRSTGYELMHLIIGSEGTLAAVTKIILRLIKLPPHCITLYIPFQSLHDASKAVPDIIRKKVTPTAIEYIERDSLLIVEHHLEKTMPHHDAEAYLLIRIDGDSEDELYATGEAVSSICMDNHALDVLIASTKEAQERIWDIRGRFYEVLVKNHVVQMIDTVVPPSTIAAYIDDVKAIAQKWGIRIFSVGHAGDGNVHLMLLKDDLSDDVWTDKWPQVMKHLYATAVAYGGTISGEHGIGVDKKAYLPLGINASALDLMKAIKRLFDPHAILNPGKIFDLP
jgi:glycolate oxidase